LSLTAKIVVANQSAAGVGERREFGVVGVAMGVGGGVTAAGVGGRRRRRRDDSGRRRRRRGGRDGRRRRRRRRAGSLGGVGELGSAVARGIGTHSSRFHLWRGGV
jgi:hypothetical protein